MKYVINGTPNPLCYMIDISLKNGVFRKCLKMVLVIPTFKKSENLDIENYRLRTLGTEYIISPQLVDFIGIQNLLSGIQHGYIKEK